jgi:hypothetical protein
MRSIARLQRGVVVGDAEEGARGTARHRVHAPAAAYVQHRARGREAAAGTRTLGAQDPHLTLGTAPPAARARHVPFRVKAPNLIFDLSLIQPLASAPIRSQPSKDSTFPAT